MSTRNDIINSFYSQVDEDGRLQKTRHGQLEYFITMTYIHRFTHQDSRVLEIGAGTGRYSIALAKEGMNVTAVELVESNLSLLRENSKGIENIESFRGDATNLERFFRDSFDVTLVLGPMYHLYENREINKAIDEAVRVTKPGGVIMFAFLSVYGIMYANYSERQINLSFTIEPPADAHNRIRNISCESSLRLAQSKRHNVVYYIFLWQLGIGTESKLYG